MLNVSAVDKDGNFAGDVNDEICVELDGAELLGIGNGNPTSRESDILKTHKLFNGRCQVIVRANKDKFRCTVTAEGLLSANIIVDVNIGNELLPAVYNRFDLCDCIRYDMPVEKEEARYLELTNDNKLHWNGEVFYDNTTLFKKDEYGKKLYLFNTEKLEGKKCIVYIEKLEGKLVLINGNEIVAEISEDSEIVIERMSNKLKLLAERKDKFNIKLPIAVSWEEKE